MAKLGDLLVPRSGWRARDESQRKAERDADLDDINAANWALNTELALAEAERIYLAEADRRRTAETKATTYLVLVTALVPILVSIQTSLWEKKAGPAPMEVSLSVTIIALVYMSRAGFYLLRVIATSQSYRVDTPDILHFWRKSDRRQALVREKLSAARLTQDEVNRKVSYVRAAQLNLYNAAVALAILLAVNSIWYLGERAANGLQDRRQEIVPVRPGAVAKAPTRHQPVANVVERDTSGTGRRPAPTR